MKENKELQKKLKKAFETPDIPFDEWAEKRGVFKNSSDSGAVDYSLYAPADNVSGRGMSNGRNKLLLILGALAVAIVIALAIVLPIVLHRPDTVELPEIFGENDIERVQIELAEITEREDVYLFDMTNVAKTEYVSKDVLKTDNTRVMLYSIINSLLSVENGESEDGFYLTYYIRTYPYYEFLNLKDYSRLDNQTTVNNMNIAYQITDKDEISYGYASFSAGNYEYFIEAYGFEGITVLNEDNFLNLLNKVLI